MVWGAFISGQKLPLVLVEDNLDSADYKRLMELHIVPVVHGANHELIYQQDNAPAHIHGHMEGFFERAGVSTMDWPSRSPDLNPIENVWGLMVDYVYSNGRQYSTVDDLKKAVFAAWEKVPASYLHLLVEGMHERMMCVMDRQGAKINK